MFQNPQPQPVPQHRRVGRSWLRVLLIGLVLFIATTVVMFFTGNPNLYPTVILIGNFLVPVAFVAFLYDHQHLSMLSPARMASSFCIGGVLGVLGASILESLLIPSPTNPLRGLSLGSALAVGLIEEGCKALAVILVARRLNHTSEMDGLLLGGAVGMGFAALESTGYAFTTFLVSHGLVGASIFSTILRGLLAPFGHGCWTAIIGAALFRQSEPHRFRINGPVIGAYLFVSVLHALWDGLPETIYFVIPPGLPIPIIAVLLGIIGIVVLAIIYRRAINLQMKQTVGTP